MQKRGCTKVWLAKQLYCHRTNIGNILKRQSIDTNQLFLISKILQVDFFELYVQEFERENNYRKREKYDYKNTLLVDLNIDSNLYIFGG